MTSATGRTSEAQKPGDSESAQMPKVVLEVIGKRCKFVAIEIEQIRCLSGCSGYEINRAELSQQTQVPRVSLCEARAYHSAEQLIPDP